MDELKRTVEINRLLDIYGRLLTTQQFDIMSDYFKCDLSLSEISENRSISRAAASDTIKNASKKLENFEEKIGICKVFDFNKNEMNKELFEKLEEEIKNGI